MNSKDRVKIIRKLVAGVEENLKEADKGLENPTRGVNYTLRYKNALALLGDVISMAARLELNPNERS